jgi:hypothetical protein
MKPFYGRLGLQNGLSEEKGAKWTEKRRGVSGNGFDRLLIWNKYSEMVIN